MIDGLDGRSNRTNLGYGFTPSTSKREIPEISDPLYTVFEKWIKKCPHIALLHVNIQPNIHPQLGDRKDHDNLTGLVNNLYVMALEEIARIQDVTSKKPEDIHSVALTFGKEGRILENAGIFLSAFYNIIDEKDILFNLETEASINLIGYRLSQGKRLALTTHSGHYTGLDCFGDILNYGINHGIDMAEHCEGNVVNFGESEVIARYSKGIAINCGRAASLGFLNSGVAINFGKSRINPSTHEGLSVNCESWKQKDKKSPTVLRIKYPGGKYQTMNPKEAGKYPKLVRYLKDLKGKIEAYRNLQFPECLDVFDVLEQEIGNKYIFEQKIKELL